MGRLEGKVAFITGVARGMGRSHALRFAEEGADVIGVDICADIPSIPYPMATADDLEETRQLVVNRGRRVITRRADVRDMEALSAAVDDGLEAFGKIDVVCANAGVCGIGRSWELDEREWDDVVGTILKGSWNTIRATLPHMIERGTGGSIILISSGAAWVNAPNVAHYAAAKAGVISLSRVVANELHSIRSGIRINCILPTSVPTSMIMNDHAFRLFRPDLDHPTIEDVEPAFSGLNLLPIPWIDAEDVSNAAIWLASDEARYVTGVALPVDAGYTQKTPSASDG